MPSSSPKRATGKEGRTPKLRPADVRAFLDRPWEELRAQTDAHRAARATQDPEWAWRTAIALREDVAMANPGWPTAEDRALDLEHHLRLRRLLDRAGHELRRRRSR